MANNQTQIEISAVDKTRAAFDSVNQSLGKIKTTATSVNSAFGAFGAALSVGAFAGFTKSAIQYADSINDIAVANEVAVSSVLKLSNALTVAGGSSDSAGKLFASFSSKVEEAASGNDKTRENFKKLGISLKDLEKLDSEALFSKTLESLSKIEDPLLRNARAADVFGKAIKGVDIVGLNEEFKNNKKNYDAAEKSFKDIGKAVDELDRLTLKLKVDLATGLGESFLSLTKGLNAYIDGLDKVTVKQKLANALLALNPLGANLSILNTIGAGYTPPKQTTAALPVKNADESKRLIEASNADSAKVKASAKEAENYIDKLKKQVATFGESKAAALEYDATQVKLTATQKAQAAVLIEQIKVQENLAEQQKRTGSYASDLTAIFALNNAEKTNVTIMQEKLNLMVQLPDAIRAAAEAELELARAAEAYNTNQAAQNIGIDNEIDAFNEQYQAEKDATDARNQVFAESAEQLKRENEDLNASLLTSDRARARAQLDLEHARSLERINSLVLEGDQTQELIDQETKNYELRKKQIDQTRNITKELGLTFTSAFENAVVGGQKLSGILQSLADDIAKLILRKKVTEPLFDAVSEGVSGSGINDFFSGLFGGFKASGGSVDPSKFYVVGEQGPELFVPTGSGSIVPNHALGGSSQNNNISIVVNADGSGRQEAGNANDLGRRIESAVRTVLVQEKRPGGLIGA